MPRSLSLVLVLSISFFATRAVAQEDAAPEAKLAAVVEPAEPTPVDAETPTEPVIATQQSLQVSSAADAQLVLDDINRRSSVATALYASSTVLLVTGAVGCILGPVLVLGGSGTTSDGSVPAQVVVGWSVFVLSMLSLVGHATMLSLAIAYDAGSGYRRRRFQEAHPDFRARLTSGPGDVGLGLALDF